MNTPETDKRVWSDHSEGILHEVVEASFARKLERERDEARDIAEKLSKQGLEMMDENRSLKQERDEAREDLEFRRGLYKVQEEYLEEAREKAERYRLEANALMLQRDEAREVLREIAEANGFDNIGNWARNKARKEINRYREKNDLLPISWDV